MTYVGKDSEDHTNTCSHREVMEIRKKEGKKNPTNISKVVESLSNRQFLQILYFDISCCLNKKSSHLGERFFKDKNKSRKELIQSVLKLNDFCFVVKYI